MPSVILVASEVAALACATLALSLARLVAIVLSCSPLLCESHRPQCGVHQNGPIGLLLNQFVIWLIRRATKCSERFCGNVRPLWRLACQRWPTGECTLVYRPHQIQYSGLPVLALQVQLHSYTDCDTQSVQSVTVPRVRATLDSGSGRSYISAQLAHKLGIKEGDFTSLFYLTLKPPSGESTHECEQSVRIGCRVMPTHQNLYPEGSSFPVVRSVLARAAWDLFGIELHDTEELPVDMIIGSGAMASLLASNNNSSRSSAALRCLKVTPSVSILETTLGGMLIGNQQTVTESFAVNYALDCCNFGGAQEEQQMYVNWRQLIQDSLVALIVSAAMYCFCLAFCCDADQ